MIETNEFLSIDYCLLFNKKKHFEQCYVADKFKNLSLFSNSY
jgi:hypothetical protein